MKVPGRKLIAGICLAMAGVLALSIFAGFITPLTPATPAVWRSVHAGMHRADILKQVGSAHTGLFPEKICEQWQLDGALGLRKLVVTYGNGDDYDRAMLVTEYIFWRPSQREIILRKEQWK